jgi:purine-binding chemotaxis protein CheW
MGDILNDMSAMEQTTPMEKRPPEYAAGPSDPSGKYLVFALGTERYALPIGAIREIIGITDYTLVPKAPSHIKGVFNLRGHIVPVLDMRLRFRMKEVPYTEETCIIILEIGDAMRGVIVDRVVEVENYTAAQIEPPPPFGDLIDTSFITGVAKRDDSVTVLLAPGAIFLNQDAEERRATAGPVSDGE